MRKATRQDRRRAVVRFVLLVFPKQQTDVVLDRVALCRCRSLSVHHGTAVLDPVRRFGERVYAVFVFFQRQLEILLDRCGDQNLERTSIVRHKMVLIRRKKSNNDFIISLYRYKSMRPHKTRRQKRYKKSRKGGFFKYFRKGKGEQVGEQVGNKERDPKFWTSPFSYVYRKLSRKSKKPSDRTVDMPLQDGHEGITIDFNHPNESSSVKSRPKSVTRSKSPGILDRVPGYEHSTDWEITDTLTGEKFRKMSRKSKKPNDEGITYNFPNESTDWEITNISGDDNDEEKSHHQFLVIIRKAIELCRKQKVITYENRDYSVKSSPLTPGTMYHIRFDYGNRSIECDVTYKHDGVREKDIKERVWFLDDRWMEKETFSKHYIDVLNMYRKQQFTVTLYKKKNVSVRVSIDFIDVPGKDSLFFVDGNELKYAEIDNPLEKLFF